MTSWVQKAVAPTCVQENQPEARTHFLKLWQGQRMSPIRQGPVDTQAYSPALSSVVAVQLRCNVRVQPRRESHHSSTPPPLHPPLPSSQTSRPSTSLCRIPVKHSYSDGNRLVQLR